MSRILNEIEEALGAATPRPWKCDKGTIFNDECPVVTIGELNMGYETGEFRRSTPNSRLVTALVNNAEALLRVCRAAKALMDIEGIDIRGRGVVRTVEELAKALLAVHEEHP